MRFLKLASAKNPKTDYILLNGGYFDKDANKINTFSQFNGLLCTSFQTLGIKRKLDFLAVENIQFAVDNKPEFNKYVLTIEILSKYSEYEKEYGELMSFISRNKKEGFRLYYKACDNKELRFCLCDIESIQKTDKLKPIVLTLAQSSLWYGKENKSTTAYSEQQGNLFEFKDEDGYYSAGFYKDEDLTSDYYCVSFYSNIETEAIIKNNSYNEIPLNIKVYGECVNPVIKLFRYGEEKPIMQTSVNAIISDNYYLEINANIKENGVWYVNKTTYEKIDISELVDNKLGSPYFYIGYGKYIITVEDDVSNICVTDIFYNEEYDDNETNPFLL